MFDDTGSSRRAFLGMTATSLTTLAGCTSAIDGLREDTTKKSGTAGTANTTNPSETRSATADTKTSSAGTSSDGGKAPEDPKTLVYESTITTSYGIDLQGNPVMGSPDAPVDIYYWSDYQCPFCKKFEQETFPKLVDDHIRPGTVQFVVLEYPNIGDASRTAARIAKCVWRQVRDENPTVFKRWHATVFDEQGKPNSGWATKEKLLDITSSVDGVDAGAVESCLHKNDQYARSAVSEDVNAGIDNSVSATPTFIFHGTESDTSTTIKGAQPYPRFEAAIQQTKDV
ncbi:DsbA family protein [Haladaptatus sp. NG-SE-30]